MKANHPPLVYIILVTWNHWEVTQACLATITELSYPHYQIIVVDNGSTDRTVPQIKANYPTITVIDNGRNWGFARGCNIGINHALQQNADYILLLNNDTLVKPNFLTQFVEATMQLPNVGITAPLIRYAAEPYPVWFTASRRHRWTNEAIDFGPVGPRQHIIATKPQKIDYIFGTAMLIPREPLQKVGGFDEKFFMYFEDMDLCLRYQKAGYSLYYLPQVSLLHQVEASTSQFSALRHYYKAKSSILFFRKHTYGWHWFILIPARFASMMRTTGLLIRHRQIKTLRYYWRGIGEGLRMEL